MNIKILLRIMDRWKILDGHWHWKSKFGVVLIALAFCVMCKPNSKKKSEEPSKVQVETTLKFEQLPEDFRNFYRRFHEDSSFQMQSIVFPLAGLPDRADPEDVKNDPFYFTADQWTVHKPIDSASNEIGYINMEGLIIEERILEKKYKLITIRRFAKASGGWRLIYYAGLNKYAGIDQL